MDIKAMRHSAAHVMAEAIKEIYPKAQFAFGPETENGFYYDVEIPDGQITNEDLPKIRKLMQKIIKSKTPLTRRELPREEALQLFKNQKYKIRTLNELLKNEKSVSIYTQNGFTDLCKGPHVEHTGQIGAFAMDKIAGAYWLGDAKNEPLQRIYGFCFATIEELKEYKKLLEEAKKRDHRVTGKKLDLFSFHEEGAGFVFWHPKGLTLFNLLIDFIREDYKKLGAQEIKTPIVLGEELWHTSGHYENFKDDMYFTQADDRRFALKPMNCPGSILIYKEKLYSYRDLPLRLMEMGQVHRFELSGVLHGLFRVRAFTQDDGHIYCAPEQIEGEIIKFVESVFAIYSVFGFTDVGVYIATRPESSIGSDDEWKNATTSLKNALEKQGVPYDIKEGEGAFYGPKIEFNVKDCLNRNWQLGTIQVDFSMPKRFDIEYVGSDSAKHTPVLLHRAILGSLERFIGIYLEQVAGKLPVWLAPVQAMIIPIADAQNEYSRTLLGKLLSAGIRAEADFSPERMNKKIRNAQLQKIPYMIVVGEKEVADKNLSVRLRSGENINGIPVKEFIDTAKNIADSKAGETLWPKLE